MVWAVGNFLKENALALAALIVSGFALLHSHRSAVAANRSADAAETSNEYSRKSAAASEISSKISQTIYENDFKRLKARAYWMLYRIHNLIDPRIFLASRAANELFDTEKIDLSPVQDYLSIYSYTHTNEECHLLRTALNGIELLVAHPVAEDEKTKIHQAVMAAALTLREEWSGKWPEPE